MNITEDLTKLSPKRLARRLEELSHEALPCISATVFDGNPRDGLTVGLWVESRDRRDVVDLARVLETEPRGQVATSWSLLRPAKGERLWRLLLRVDFERPVSCAFVVRLDVHEHADDQLRQALALLLAANGFAVAFDRPPEEAESLVWVPAPGVRDCVLETLFANRG